MSVPPSIIHPHDHGIVKATFKGEDYSLPNMLSSLPTMTLRANDTIMVELSPGSDLSAARTYLSRWLSVEGWLWFGQHGLTHTLRDLPRTARIKISFSDTNPLTHNTQHTIPHPLFMTQPEVSPVLVPVRHLTDVRKLKSRVKTYSHRSHYTLIVTPPKTYPGSATITRNVLRGAPWFTHVEGDPGLEMLSSPDAAEWLKYADRKSWRLARQQAPAFNHGVLINACHSELGISALPHWLPFETRMDAQQHDYERDHHEQHMYLIIPGYARRRALEIMRAYSRRHTNWADYADQSPTIRQRRMSDAVEILREEGMDTDDFFDRQRRLIIERAQKEDASDEQIERNINNAIAALDSPEKQRRERILSILTHVDWSGGDPDGSLGEEDARDFRNRTMFWYLPIKDLFDEDALDCINHGGSPSDPDQAIAWRGYPERLIDAPDAPILAVRVPLSQELAVMPAELDAMTVAHEAFGDPEPRVTAEYAEFMETSRLPWIAATSWADHETRGRKKGSGKRRGRHEYDSGGIGIHLQHRAASIFSDLMYEFVSDAGTEGAMMPVAGIEDAAREIDWQHHYDADPMLFFALVNYVRAYHDFQEFNPLPDLDIPALKSPGIIETNRPGSNYRVQNREKVANES